MHPLKSAEVWHARALALRLEVCGRIEPAERAKCRGEFFKMPDDHLRFRCYRCNQLLGASAKRAGSIITCPKCGAELKVPRPDEQMVATDASRSGPGLATESRVPSRPSPSTARSGGSGLPPFMDEIAAAIPDDLATLRPEDIRVEAGFADLVISTSEGLVTPAPAEEESRGEPLPGNPAALDAYFAQSSPATEVLQEAPAVPPSVFQAQAVTIVPPQAPPVVPVQPPPAPAQATAFAPAPVPPVPPVPPRSADPPLDLGLDAVLPAIKIETTSLLPPARQAQPVNEVILQPATVLAWSLLVLMALPLAFLAGLLMGHFVWK